MILRHTLCFESSLPRLGLDVGAAVSVFIEIGVAGKDIKNAWEKWSSGLKTGGEFLKETAGKVIARVEVSLAALIGVFAGHLVAYHLSELLLSQK